MAIAQSLNPAPSGPVIEVDDNIATEVLIETDPSGETTISIGEMPAAEAFIPHEANLADHMDDRDLSELAGDLMEAFEQDKSSRSEWEATLEEGMNLLGIKLEEVSEPFDGACGAHHPLLLEACLQFQARAVAELCPPDGPVKAKIIGDQNDEVLSQARRVEQHMNWQLTEECEEYYEDMDRLLFSLPIAGIAFKKTYFDPSMDRITSRFVKAQDFVVDNESTDLATSGRYCHVLNMAENDIRRGVHAGTYRDVEYGDAYSGEVSRLTQAENDLIGVNVYSHASSRHRVLEFHADLDLPGDFAHIDEDGEQTGIALPYIVTIHDGSGEVMSIRRNYREDDSLYRKLSWFTTYKFLPGLGFYGLGFIHVLGNLEKTATAILRALVDSGQYANLPGGFKARGMRLSGDQPIAFGEFRDVEGVGDDLRKSIIPLPTKEPSQTLFLLLGAVTDFGRRLAANSDISVGDADTRNAAVGSVSALQEAGAKLMSSIHRRLHRAQRNELRVFSRLNAENANLTDYQSGSARISPADYDGRVDVVPVTDPSMISESQRLQRAQAQLQIAQQFPAQHNIRAALHRMHVTLGTKDIDALLLPERGPERADPATENFSFFHGKPAKAFADQDHASHMAVHQTFLMGLQSDKATFAKISPVVNAHINEHQAHDYRQKIEALMQQRLPDAPDYNPLNPMEPADYGNLEPAIENEVARMQALAGQALAQQQAMIQQAQQNAAMAQDPRMQIAQQQLAIDKQEADVKAYKAQADVALRQAKINADISDDALDRELEAEKAVLDAQIKRADQQARIDAAAMNTR